MSTAATSRDELPLFFPAGEDELFGVLTRPTSEARGVAVVIAAGGGTPLSTNVNGLSVRLCRQVAALGFHAIRFDYHGVGESSGRLDRFDLASPFVSDLSGALQCLRDHGIERFVLVGSCFGARTVLAEAPTSVGLEAVILISPPIRDFEMGERVVTHLATQLSLRDVVGRALSLRGITGLFNANRRRGYFRVIREKIRRTRSLAASYETESAARYGVSSRCLEPLRALGEQGVPVSIIYGDKDDLATEFQQAKSGPLGQVLNRCPSIATTLLSGSVHGFNDAEVQERVLRFVTDWVSNLRLESSIVTT